MGITIHKHNGRNGQTANRAITTEIHMQHNILSLTSCLAKQDILG